MTLTPSTRGAAEPTSRRRSSFRSSASALPAATSIRLTTRAARTPAPSPRIRAGGIPRPRSRVRRIAGLAPPLRRSVTASLAGEASRGGRFPSPPAFGAFNSDFVNADPPKAPWSGRLQTHRAPCPRRHRPPSGPVHRALARPAGEPHMGNGGLRRLAWARRRLELVDQTARALRTRTTPARLPSGTPAP